MQYNGRCPLTYLDAPATANMSQEYTPHHYRNMTNRYSALMTTVVHRLMEFKLYSNTIISHKKSLIRDSSELPLLKDIISDVMIRAEAL